MSEFLDNRSRRVETLKVIIRRLHAGEAPGEVKTALKRLVRETDASEIAAMEQQLLAEGMPLSEIQGMCDLHAEVASEVLTQVAPAVAPGHPVDTFRRENEALRGVLVRLREAATPLALRQAYNDLNDIEKHYQRKEHLLFSILERHGIAGPSTAMWGKDDEIRAMLKDLGRALRNGDYNVAPAESTLAAIEEMMFKEENILLPM